MLGTATADFAKHIPINSCKFLCVSNYRNRDHIQLTRVSLQK